MTMYVKINGELVPWGGGGSVEKYQLDASGGVYQNSAIAQSVGDRIWDHLEPYAGGTSLANGFYSMVSITRVPMFDTSNVTSMYGMFNSCSSLVEIPPFDTSNVTNMGYMFHGCRSLVEIPELDMSAATTLRLFTGSSSLATQLASLTRFKAFGATQGFVLRGTQMQAAALNELMSNLGTAAGAQTLDIRDNPGSSTCDPSIATAKGWKVTT